MRLTSLVGAFDFGLAKLSVEVMQSQGSAKHTNGKLKENIQNNNKDTNFFIQIIYGKIFSKKFHNMPRLGD